MIADDSDAIRLVLKDILSIGKHTIVAEAVNGDEAVDLFFKKSPDLLLLDLAMPKKDGLTVDRKSTRLNSSHVAVSRRRSAA